MIRNYTLRSFQERWDTVDVFLEILHQLRLVVYLIIYKDLYIPGGC